MVKTVFIRIRKVAPGRYLIEERHKFMFFWQFWIKGSIKLKLPKYFASNRMAEQAINQAAKKKGIRPFIIKMSS